MKKVASVVFNNFINDSRVLKTAISLTNNNYDVTVFALFEDGLASSEEIYKVKVRRIKLFSRSFWSKSKPIQILKYFQFLLKVSKYAKQLDIIHCNDLIALPIGVILKFSRNKNLKIVYDAHEYETQMHGQSKIEQIFSSILEKLCIKYSDITFTVSESISKEYEKLYHIKRPIILYNTPISIKLSRENNSNNHFRKKFNIGINQKIFIYQGGISVGRGIETILTAFDFFNSTIKTSSELPVIIFMGYGPLTNMVKKYSEFCSNIFYHKAVSVGEVLNYTKNADYGINFLGNSCLNHNYCMPNKLFEYLMAELPLVTSNLKDVKTFVNHYKVGQVSETNDVYGLIKAIEQILNKDLIKLKSNILKVKDEYNWQNQEVKLIKEYTKIVT